MPALIATNHTAKVVWLGQVADRSTSLCSAPVTAVDARFSGPAGESHSGLTRPSCGRVKTQYPLGTDIRNTRQFSIVSSEELAEIADKMGVVTVAPEWLGASMVVAGLPDFTHIPPSSRLQGPSGATLTIDMLNRPCHLPAKVIDLAIDGAGAKFKQAAVGRRGVTAWVEREGRIAVNDQLTLHVPGQRHWNPAE